VLLYYYYDVLPYFEIKNRSTQSLRSTDAYVEKKKFYKHFPLKNINLRTTRVVIIVVVVVNSA